MPQREVTCQLKQEQKNRKSNLNSIELKLEIASKQSQLPPSFLRADDDDKN